MSSRINRVLSTLMAAALITGAAQGAAAQSAGRESPAPRSAARNPAADVESTVLRFYAAMRFVNVDSLMAMLADDFRIVTGRDSLDRKRFKVMMANMKSGAPQELTDFRTTVRDTIAETSYRRVAMNASGAKFLLQETAVLRRRQSRWLIVRMEAKR